MCHQPARAISLRLMGKRVICFQQIDHECYYVNDGWKPTSRLPNSWKSLSEKHNKPAEKREKTLTSGARTL